MTADASIIAVILAGGQGRRFGGVDKSFLSLAGKPLLAHVVARIAPQVSEVMVNAGADGGRFRGLGVRIVADQPCAMPATGPLVGLISTFSALRRAGDVTSAILSVPVDTPFLPSDLVAQLTAALAISGAGVAYAATADRDHPIIALWRPDVREPVCALFDQQPSISLHGMMQQLRGTRVAFAVDRAIDPFLNVNRPEDLEAAERALCPSN